MPMTEEARMKHQRRKERLLARAKKGDKVALRTIEMLKARRHAEKLAEQILAKRRKRRTHVQREWGITLLGISFGLRILS